MIPQSLIARVLREEDIEGYIQDFGVTADEYASEAQLIHEAIQTIKPDSSLLRYYRRLSL